MSLEDLERGFLSQRRPELERFRRLARQHETVADLAAHLETELPESFAELASLRRFALGPSERGAQEGEERLDLHAARIRPVGRLPGNKALLCLMASASGAVVEAERHARAFASALWVARGRSDPPELVVWKHSGWGSTPWRPRHEPSIDGLSGVLEAIGGAVLDPVFTPAFQWVHGIASREAAWAEARARGEVADVELIGPFMRLWATGCGMSAVNDDCIVLFLGEQQAVPTRSGAVRSAAADEALHRACARPDPAAIERALSNGADPNATRDGSTPLNRLVISLRFAGNPVYARRAAQAFRVLVDGGADPRRPDPHGWLPITRWAHREDVVDELQTAEVDLEVVGPFGRTPLHQLARTYRVGALQNLLTRGVEVDPRDALGWTPLHHACAAGIVDNVRVLLRYDADGLAPTASGSTPRQLAADAPRAEVVLAVLPEGTSRVSHRSITGTPLEIPETFVFAVRDGEADAMAVLADWLEEEGDPRGEALSLALGGLEGAADAVLHDRIDAWWTPLLAVDSRVETLLSDPAAQLQFEHGFLTQVSLGAVRNQEHVRAALALVGSPAGVLTEQLRVEALGGDLALAGLSALRAPALQQIRIHANGALPRPLDLRGLPALASLTLRGPALAGLELTSSSLRSLTIELPFLRDAELPPPLAAVDAPLLRSVALTWHRAPDAAAIIALEQVLEACPQVDTLNLRPVSLDALDALLESELLRRVRRVRLDSLFGAAVRRLLDRAGQLAHLDGIGLSVLDVDKPGRDALSAEFTAHLPTATLKGISYRAAGGYG